jgi:hypothetical protein
MVWWLGPSCGSWDCLHRAVLSDRLCHRPAAEGQSRGTIATHQLAEIRLPTMLIDTAMTKTLKMKASKPWSNATLRIVWSSI